ncbi:flavin-containing monooxygenase [Solirubrobacter soli]|uniref:flavin-containing monooxygenase n=1 Tax=Solirubrobacter soli TaxID=363832 RepID=UPI000487EFF5|nr:NAD(P)/FAD-dependent oxidoreductase [Solirubrobacter soli]
MTAAVTVAFSDEQIERAVAHAEPMVLRGLLYQLTGDEEAAATRVTVDPAGFQTFMMVASEEDAALLRAKAAALLRRIRDSGPVDIGPEERLRRSIPLVLGEELSDAEYEYCREELGLDPWARALAWTPPAELGFSVTVIGAGFGGLDAAVMLKRAGIPYTVIEKDSGVGGTWWETRYPGARVDTPSRAYTHIFGAQFPYSSPFCGAAENRRYFDWVADEFGVREDIQFDTEVLALTWDETAAEWEIEVDGPGGRRTLRSNAVITAVGFLNRPRVPSIEGMDSFGGRSWHTSRWPDDADVAGKRVAVVGTGCTGYQLIPELALVTEHVVAFQRTAQWLFGVKGYLSPFEEEVPWLDRHLPYYTNFMRLRMFGTGKAFMRMTEVDPGFDDPYAVSARNKVVREASLSFLHSKVADPELREKMTPPHPPWSARAVVVDTDYNVLDAIQRDDVTLVTSGIRRITPTGIEDGDGVHHEVDAIVYATGFHASEYLYPMQVTGVGGITLDRLWEVGGARAHRFCMYPGFPNLWSVYGPNTNGVLGPATFHDFVVRYAIECMHRLIEGGARAIEPRREAYDRFNEDVDARNARKVWSDPRAHNYYWTEHGRSAVMCPFNSPEIFHLLRHPAFDELEVR